MHEMGIAIQILNIVKESLPPDEEVKVKAIHLRVGKLTAIVPQSLRFLHGSGRKGFARRRG